MNSFVSCSIDCRRFSSNSRYRSASGTTPASLPSSSQRLAKLSMTPLEPALDARIETAAVGPAGAIELDECAQVLFRRGPAVRPRGNRVQNFSRARLFAGAAVRTAGEDSPPDGR